jgi:hypothetical protein
MLLWIKGNLNPQELRDQMATNPEFQTTMFQWIESIVQCQLPSTLTEIFEHSLELLHPPEHDNNDPRLQQRPQPTLPQEDKNNPESRGPH